VDPDGSLTHSQTPATRPCPSQIKKERSFAFIDAKWHVFLRFPVSIYELVVSLGLCTLQFHVVPSRLRTTCYKASRFLLSPLPPHVQNLRICIVVHLHAVVQQDIFVSRLYQDYFVLPNHSHWTAACKSWWSYLRICGSSNTRHPLLLYSHRLELIFIFCENIVGFVVRWWMAGHGYCFGDISVTV